MKIAYLTNCFGSQSHTFMRREIRALRNLGLPLALYGIRKDVGSQADDAQDLVAETQYLYPISATGVIRSNLSCLLRSPARYFCGLWRSVSSPEFSLKRRAKMLYHYLLAPAFARHMQSQGVTHIHAHFMNVSASIAMYAAHHSGIPFSITVHSAGTYKTPHILGVDQKLRSAQFLIMISENNINYFDPIVPCRDKSHVVRCGMDLSNFTLKTPEQQTPHNPPQILAVGRFVEKKGFIYLIEAMHLLQQSGFAAQLTLIGGGPLESELKQKATELQLSEHVHFAGPKSIAEVHQAMGNSDLVIVPSVTSKSGEQEGLPVVIMEAMATGVPVIASEHSGIPEIVQPGVTGTLTPEKSPKAIAQAIKDTLSRDNSTLIHQAHQLVEETFNIDAVAQQRCDLFNRYADTH